MKTEISAGGIVVRISGKTWDVVVLQDANDTWTFPKGKIESGEKPEEAARRETHEEIGLQTLTMLMKFPAIGYTYKKNGFIKKTVHYFLFESKGNERIINQSEEGIHNATWIPIDGALMQIGYKKTNRPLLEQVKTFLSSYGH